MVACPRPSWKSTSCPQWPPTGSLALRRVTGVDQAVFHRFSRVCITCSSMHADRCIARGATSSSSSSRLKVHLVLHTHTLALEPGFSFSPWHCSCQYCRLCPPPPPLTSCCLRRSDILLTAQLLDSLTVSVSSRSTHLLPSAGTRHMQPTYTLVATCPLCPTEVAHAVIIPRWSWTNGPMTNFKRASSIFFLSRCGDEQWFAKLQNAQNLFFFVCSFYS